MLAVMLTSKGEESVIETASVLAGKVKESGMDCTVVGPAPAGIRKINDIYREVFMIKSKTEENLILLKDLLENQFEHHLAKDVAIQFDFNPVSPY